MEKREEINKYIAQIGLVLHKNPQKREKFQQNLLKQFYHLSLDSTKIKSDIKTYLLGLECQFLNKELDIVKWNKYFSQMDFNPEWLLNLNLNPLLKEVDNSFNKLEVAKDFDVFRCVQNFYKKYFPDKEEEVANILKTKLIIQNEKGRSVTKDKVIYFYYQNKVTDALTLAHEISHMLFKGQMKCSELKEVESMLTEEMFLNYLVDISLPVFCEGREKLFSQTDRASYHQLIHYHIAELYFRMQKEVLLKKLLHNQMYFTPYTLTCFAHSSHLLDLLKSGLYIQNGIFANYLKENVAYKPSYDLENGRHLQNEVRFIYAGLLTSIFNAKPKEEQAKIYHNYFKNISSLNGPNIAQILVFLENIFATKLDKDTILKYYQMDAAKCYESPPEVLKH